MAAIFYCPFEKGVGLIEKDIWSLGLWDFCSNAYLIHQIVSKKKIIRKKAFDDIKKLEYHLRQNFSESNIQIFY